ncbi:anti sigma factor C-terminal domain-containing protein [Serpentinicella alkaliphila]|uniref:Sigma factor regulator n=1 Tax=Serpentinicella alkaliphila TaxID=1734049 RepID=A0A4R2TD03_9FIRM|nr:anti sigma factor C-terminal domain-containing protein [Serpentinicella alkaliphila]QUH25804.1 anti sigma factor C-terminal domain-containing protein [Serpentinicella alkaliphila]TCP99816.1 sigma factor regulator [Serpentinicella alkaliphila]
MNFKDLLKRYKEGTATDEEVKIIEEELEKYESLEGYFAESISDQFFKTDKFDGETLPINGDEIRNIQKVVNHRLVKVVITSVFIVIVLYIGFFYGVSSVVDKMYYDPTAITQSEEQQFKSSDFSYDMQAYISLNMPGHSIYSFTFQKPKGFGTYELSYSLWDLFTKNDQRHFIDLSRGRITHAIDGIFSTQNRFSKWQGFEKILYPFPEYASKDAIILRDEDAQRKNEVTLRYLNELNPLSFISMSIVFDEDLTMEEFYHMRREYSALDFKWVGVRTTDPGTQWSETQPMHLVGFNPNFNDEPSSNRRPDSEKYPLFNLVDMWDERTLSEKDFPEAYGTHFRSRLKYLRNRKEFVEIFDYNFYKIDFYDDAIKYIDEHGVKTYGVLVYGTAEEFLEHIDEIPYDTIHINSVLSTRPNIYYR